MDMQDPNNATNTDNQLPDTKVDQDLSDIACVESEHGSAASVDNDHTIDDVTTHNKLQETSAALAKEKTKRRTNPLLTLLLSLLLIGLGAAAGIMGYKYLFEKLATTDAVSTTTAPAQTPDDKLLAVIQRIREIMPSTIEPKVQMTDMPVHRQMGAPYNFYASAPYDKRFDVTTSDTLELTEAAKATKAIHDYLVSDQKAKADKIFDVSADSSFLIKDGATTDTPSMYRYRYTTDTYTCGMFEHSIASETPPYSTKAANISVTCQTANNYLATAKAQQPFYDAIKASPEASKLEKDFMLDIVQSPRPSQVIGYKTTATTIGGDQMFVGRAQALFYQTPDKKWHYFTSVQSSPGCEEYSTVDLKKAYLGTQCFTKDGKESVVSL